MTAYDPKPTYTIDDVGCYADGVNGHRHIRLTLADMVEEATQRSAEGKKLAKELRGEMSDDASEEDEALDLLNERCSPEVYFEFHEGDLMLTASEEEYERDEDPSEPSEDDWATADHKTFTQYGRPILTLTGEESEVEMWAAILSTMSADNFYPNVWFISDHGNAHLMRDPRVLDPVSGVLK